MKFARTRVSIINAWIDPFCPIILRVFETKKFNKLFIDLSAAQEDGDIYDDTTDVPAPPTGMPWRPPPPPAAQDEMYESGLL